MDSTRSRRRAESRLRAYRQRRRTAAAVLFAIVAAAFLASKGGGSGKGGAPAGGKPHAKAIVDGGPIAPASVGGLAALWAPANVVGLQPGTAAAYAAASRRPGPAGYILIADRGNNRVLVVNPQGEVVFLYPTPEDLAKGRRLVYNDDTFVVPLYAGLKMP